MNFKRGRRKNCRAGCLMCKPHKANGCKPKVWFNGQGKKVFYADTDLKTWKKNAN